MPNSATPVKVTLVRDETKAKNHVIVTEVSAILQALDVPVKARLLHTWLGHRKDLTTLMVRDTLLLGRLKAAGAIEANASQVKLASCAAMRAAVSRHPDLRSVADAVQRLTDARPPLQGTAPIPPPGHLSCAAAFEARMPSDWRCGSRMPPPTPTSPSPAPPPSTPPSAAAPSPPPRAFRQQRAPPPPPPPPPPTSVEPQQQYVPSPRTGTMPPPPPPPPPPRHACQQQHGPPQPRGSGLPQQVPSPPPPPSKRSPRVSTAPPVAGAAANPAGPLGSSSGGGRSPAEMYYPVDLPFPYTLPNRDWGLGSGGPGRYGILQFLRRGGLGMPTTLPALNELPVFEEWATQRYNFGEGGTAGVSAETCRGLKNTVSKLLGFAHSWLGVRMPYLSMRLFSNQVRCALCSVVAGCLRYWVQRHLSRHDVPLWRLDLSLIVCF
jgi:hypothetical protein